MSEIVQTDYDIYFLDEEDDGYVTISKEYFRELLDCQRWYEVSHKFKVALTWDRYSEAMRAFYAEKNND